MRLIDICCVSISAAACLMENIQRVNDLGGLIARTARLQMGEQRGWLAGVREFLGVHGIRLRDLGVSQHEGFA